MRLDEKPSIWRRIAQFFCSHWAWEGNTLNEDSVGRVVTIRQCMTCGLKTWETHEGWWKR